MPLTGRFEFRRTLTGKVVLRVEEERERRWKLGSQSRTYRRWRYATMTDLMQRELGELLDLKNGARGQAVRPAEGIGRASPAGDNAGRRKRLPRADSFEPILESRDAAE